MSSGASARKHQASGHDPKAVTDMDATVDWATRYRPQPDDKRKIQDALEATEKTPNSGKTKPTGHKKVSRWVEDLIIRLANVQSLPVYYLDLSNQAMRTGHHWILARYVAGDLQQPFKKNSTTDVYNNGSTDYGKGREQLGYVDSWSATVSNQYESI